MSNFKIPPRQITWSQKASADQTLWIENKVCSLAQIKGSITKYLFLLSCLLSSCRWLKGYDIKNSRSTLRCLINRYTMLSTKRVYPLIRHLRAETWPVQNESTSIQYPVWFSNTEVSVSVFNLKNTKEGSVCQKNWSISIQHSPYIE